MVEIIPKPTEKGFNWQDFLFYFSFFILLIVVLAFFLVSFNIKKAKDIYDELEKTLAKEKTPREIALEEKIFGYQRKIEDFSKLMKEHLFPSKFFEFIEENTHPQVWFSKLELNPREGKAKLSGEAENFVVLHQQRQILKANHLVENIKLSGITIGEEGKIKFDIDLELKPNLFKYE